MITFWTSFWFEEILLVDFWCCDFLIFFYKNIDAKLQAEAYLFNFCYEIFHRICWEIGQLAVCKIWWCFEFGRRENRETRKHIFCDNFRPARPGYFWSRGVKGEWKHHPSGWLVRADTVNFERENLTSQISYLRYVCSFLYLLKNWDSP